MVVGAIELGDLLWSMFVFFFLMVWIVILFQIVTDLFRDRETSGVMKAVWLLGLIVFPFLSALLYFVIRGGSMADRSIAAQQQAEKQFAAAVRSAGGATPAPADQIATAKNLLDEGVIDLTEFEKIKSKALV